MTIVKTFLMSVIFVSIVSVSATKAFAQSNQISSIAPAKIISVKATGKTNNQNHQEIKKVTIKIGSGELKGQTVTIEDNTVALTYQINYKPGDNVIVTVSEDGHGGQSIYITDYDRRPVLFMLLVFFLLLTVLIARKQGLLSLLAMLVSLYVIVQIIIPNILAGANAFTITMIGAFIIIPVTYYLSHGFNKKTTIAIAGTAITLIITALLAYFFSKIANLTGYANEDAIYLQNISGSVINVFNLLIAGILIGGLAVLNDITVSQASIVASLRKSNPNLTMLQLYNHAMEVGKDHVASLVNTLILVYVGASLPLVLLFYNTHTPLSLLLNQEIIATEIVRTLVTSIGIVTAVPVTTYLACLFVEK